MNVPRTPHHQGGIGNLPPTLGLGKTKERELSEVWDTYGSVLEDLEKRGFVLLAEPKFPLPSVTENDLLTEENRNFTIMYARVLAWHNYTKTTYAMVRAMLLQYENEVSYLEAETRQHIKKSDEHKAKADRSSVKDIEDEITTHPVRRKLALKAQWFGQQKLLLDALVDNVERNLRVISRQVEINRQEIDAENIKNNMPRRGGVGYAPNDPRHFGGG